MKVRTWDELELADMVRSIEVRGAAPSKGGVAQVTLRQVQLLSFDC